MKPWLVAGLLLAGCAAPQPVVYQRPGATEQDMRRDGYECERDARSSLGPRPTYFSHGQQWGWAAVAWDTEVRGIMQRCLEARGWRR